MNRRRVALAGLAVAAALGLAIWLVGGAGGPAGPGAGATGTPGAAISGPAAGGTARAFGPGGLSSTAARPGGPAPATSSPVLTGVVRDATSGDSVERADVIATPLRGATAGAGIGAGVSVAAGDDGRFAFDRLAPGWWRIEARADGYHLPRADAPIVRVPAPPERAAADVLLSPLAQVSGMVITKAGSPVEAALVRCTASDEAPEDLPPGLGNTTTDRAGRFDVLCRAGTVVLHARHDGFAAARSEPVSVPPAGHVGGVVLRLGAGKAPPWALGPHGDHDDDDDEFEEDGAGDGVLRGRVIDEAGAVPPAFRVLVQRTLGGAHTLRFVGVTDGRFEVPGLTAGLYVVLAAADGTLAPARKSGVRVEAGAPTDVGDLVLTTGAAVAGRVTDRATGRPVSGVAVSVSGSGGRDAPWLGTDAHTDERGDFRMEGILPGRRSVELRHPVYDEVLRTGVALEAGKETRLDATLTPRTRPGRAALEYAGIGAVMANEGSSLRVVDVVGGGPAASAGVAAGDRILSIDSAPTAGMSFTDAIEALRGIAGTPVRLEISRAAATFVVDVLRAQLSLPPPDDD